MPRRPSLATCINIFIVLDLAGAVIICAHSLASGTKPGIAIALLLAIGVPLAALAARRPFLMPFALYAASVPFNDLGNFAAIGTLSRLLGIASVVAILLWAVVHRSMRPPPVAAWMWLGVLLISGLSSGWAIDPALVWPHVLTLAQLLALYIAVAMVPATLGDVRAVLCASVIGGVIAAVYAYHSFDSGGAFGGGRLLLHDALAGEVDPDQFAAALVFPIAIALVASISARSAVLRSVALAAACVQFVVVIVTGSRGALMGLVVVSLYIVWRSKFRMRFAIPVAILLATSAPFWSMLEPRLATALISGGSGRTDIWQVGLLAFRQVWLLGAGTGNFPLIYDRAYLSVFQSNYQGYDRASHSLIIGLLVEGGLIGTLVTLSALVAQFLMLRRIRRDVPAFQLSIAVEAGLLGILVASLFLDILYAKQLWLILMLGAMLRNADLTAATKIVSERIKASNFAGSRLLLRPHSQLRSS